MKTFFKNKLKMAAAGKRVATCSKQLRRLHFLFLKKEGKTLVTLQQGAAWGGSYLPVIHHQVSPSNRISGPLAMPGGALSFPAPQNGPGSWAPLLEMATISAGASPPRI